MICAFGCHQQPSRKDAPIKGIPCHGPKGPSWTLFDAQELSARGFIHCGTAFIAQVAQTCYPQLPTHVVTVSLSPAITSLIHCTTPEPQNYPPAVTFILVHFKQLRSVLAVKRHCLPVWKSNPQPRAFSNFIYEPHAWVEEVVFLLRF
jgi:hypothetical protein